jgi:hypothetical protein
MGAHTPARTRSPERSRPARFRMMWRLRRRSRRLMAAGVGITLLGPMAVSSTAAGATPATAASDRSVECALSQILVPSCGVLWGVYSNPEEGQNAYNSVTSLESDIGREFDLVHRYHDFSNRDAQGIFPDKWERRLTNGEDGAERTLLVNWTTRIHGSEDRASWRDVANGMYDESVIRPAARRLKEWNKPIFLAFDHEAEGNRRPTQGDGPDYVAAWRHIYEIFEEVGADNVIWTWIHVGWIGLEHTVKSFYPGDEYVDWIGYDPFNYYVCRDNDWRSPGQAMGRWYTWLMRNGFDHKPIMLAEYGTVADPENEWAQAQWYRNLVPALRKHPRIRAVAHFNTHKVCDTRVTTRPDVLEAWGEAGRHPYITVQVD